MIVVALILVLLMILGPFVQRARRDAQVKKAEGQVQMLAAAIRTLAWDTGKWPGGLDRSTTQTTATWDLTTPAAGLLSADSRFSNWKGAYIQDVPLDPWNNPFFFDPAYRVNGTNRVVVGSFGPNGVGRNAYDADNIYVFLDDE